MHPAWYRHGTPHRPSYRPAGLAGPVYEVRFQGANGQAVTASAAALRPQSLTSAPGPLSFTRLSSETYVTDADSKRHVRATFRVTNAGVTALDGLTLLPVDTDDTDGDASNNATAPTVGTTPFSRVIRIPI